ncbi:MAG: hypothetical protein P4L43_20765 [Syntrophobacteraceae bacterium]|nr:hypothetical protein [Syntrophobacteraceae bacterium]
MADFIVGSYLLDLGDASERGMSKMEIVAHWMSRQAGGRLESEPRSATFRKSITLGEITRRR